MSPSRTVLLYHDKQIIIDMIPDLLCMLLSLHSRFLEDYCEPFTHILQVWFTAAFGNRADTGKGIEKTIQRLI